ncbi:DUF3987 domain-containing protein [Iodobacter ciconiae]|uniref:DUF3987 domain-containing protein n=1 Tax=Iodobacter ciconiae TaxID=2496266 RepID=A0A3S8ZPT4_9NEIS|nr:DUF3987 domain-containing protein [Iodobacter ciconiae]AZN35490.1 DUF3987 domain-containing protein [Iodobacter ciconiae]
MIESTMKNRFYTEEDARRAREKQEKKRQEYADKNTLCEYPVEYWPDFGRKLLNEVAFNLGVPTSAVAQGILTSIAAALQGNLRVTGYGENDINVVIAMLNAQMTGTGKTRVLLKCLEPIKKFENMLKDNAEKEKNELYIEKELWKCKKKIISKEMDRKNDEATKKELLSEMKFLLENKPKEGADIQIIYHSCNLAALIGGMIKYGRSAIVANDEAFNVLKYKILPSCDLANTMIDGGDYCSIGVTKGREVLKSFRLNFNLSIQNSLLASLIRTNGKVMRESGFSSRLLFSYSNVSGCNKKNIGKKLSQKYFEEFEFRIMRIAEKFHLDRVIQIGITADAMRVLSQLNTKCHDSTRYGGEYEKCTDFINRVPQHTIKVAALMMMLENPDAEEINSSVMESAVEVISYHADAYSLIFESEINYNKVGIELESRDLLEVIKNKQDFFGLRKVWLMQNGPKALRPKNRLDLALEYLENSGLVEIREYKNITHVRAILI